jgi:glycerol uptake facilitator-like aquaporin
MQVPMSFACGLFIGILCSIKVSGAHINPAVTFTQIFLREISFKKASVYLTAQFSGAFIGATLIFLNYYSFFDFYSQKGREEYFKVTANIFSTYPNELASNYVAFFDNFLATIIFIFVVKTATDKKNCPQG